jgi:peptidyl-prolyl cis-trans isomerase SurA
MVLFLLLISTLADQIAVYVGNDIILLSEVRENAAFLANDPATQTVFTNTEELREYVIDELISRKMLLLEADAESITVSRDEIAHRVDQMIAGIKQRFPSEADFYKALEEQHLTVDDLRKNYEDNLRTQMIMQQLVQKKLATKIMITPIAVNKFYDEFKDSIAVLPGRAKLSHILLPIRPSEAQLQKGFERALEVYKLLLAGGDFSIIAQEFSDDENSRKKGGMLGKISRGETLEEFEQVVFNLKPGVVSQPFITRLGYHIVEVLNKGSGWVLARQILIKVNVTRADTLRTENVAKRLSELITQGADFDSLAKIYSEDPNIDLGEFYIEQLTPPFDKVVKELDEGQLSEPVLTPYGYHLIYIKEKVPERFLSLEEMRDQIYQYLYQQELQKYYAQLLEELKERTFIKIFETL